MVFDPHPLMVFDPLIHSIFASRSHLFRSGLDLGLDLTRTPFTPISDQRLTSSTPISMAFLTVRG